jgi:hypothetical protein
MKVKLKTKKGELPGQIIDQKEDKFKIKYSTPSGVTKESWFENKEIIRLW